MSWRWCLAGSSLPIVLVALVLFAGLLGARPVAAQAVSLPLEMGYGPSAVFPVAQGSPVYEVGDQLWARSDFGGAVSFVASSINAAGHTLDAILQPGVPSLVHVFNSSDPIGPWTVTVGGNEQQVIFLLQPSLVNSTGLQVVSRAISGGSIVVGLNALVGVPFYGAQVCPLGGGDTGTVNMGVPTALGGGQLEISKGNRSLDVTGVGLGNVSFGFSVELFYSYSYASPESIQTLVTRDFLVSGSSDAILSRGNVSGSLLLQNFGTARPGVYKVRGFFEGTAGISVAETTVLLRNDGSWVWLGSCVEYPILSSSTSLTVPLGGNPQSWPRAFLLTYKVGGIEGYAESSIGANISSASFLAEPWGAPLTGYSVKLTAPAGETFGGGNGTVFVAFEGSHADLLYSLSLGGQTILQGSATLSPYSVQSVPVSLSRLDVTMLNGGEPVKGAAVIVAQSGSNLTSSTTNAAGTCEFFLPPGNYTLTGRAGALYDTGLVSLAIGQSATVVLGSQAASPQASDLDLVLAVAIILGVLLNVGLWSRRRSFRRRLSEAGQAPTNPSQK